MIFRRGVEFVSWTEAIQKNMTERERILFDSVQQLWPKNELLGEKNSSASMELGESGEESVDLEAEPAKTSFKKSKVLKTFGGNRAQTLVPGTYTYHLRWKLPLNLPLSFEDSTNATWMGSEGAVVPKMLSKGKSYIRYYATASLLTCRQVVVKSEPIKDLPMDPTQSLTKEVNKTISTRSLFKVIEDIPLIALTGQPPIISSQEKTFLFASDAPLKLTISLANGGLAFVGNSFTATIAVDNKSSRTVDSVRIGIDCITTLRVAAPHQPPVLAGLAGSQVQHIHPEAASKSSPNDWIDNVTHREVVLNTTLSELTNIVGGSNKASRISVTIPTYWPGSIVTSVHIERRYELFAECIVTMGTNLTTRCPIRLLEWCDHFARSLPDLAPVIADEDHDLDEFDIEDSSESSEQQATSASSSSVTASSSTAVATPSESIPSITSASASQNHQEIVATSSSASPSSGIASSSNNISSNLTPPEAVHPSSAAILSADSGAMDDPAL
jgi:hypothetical protein